MDLPVGDAAHGKAVDHDPPRRGDDLAGQELDDGGLTGAGGPHQKYKFPVLNGKGDALKGLRPVFVCFFNVLQSNHIISLVAGAPARCI